MWINMTCINFGSAILCYNKSYRLRLLDGRYIYMEWHNYFGPTFYYDKWSNSMTDDWWEDDNICYAIEWFSGRGKKT